VRPLRGPRIARRARLLILPLAAAVLLAPACTGSPAVVGVPAVIEVSGRVPRVSGTSLQGQVIDPATYAGRPAVFNFWATWCGPCTREQPVLSRVRRAFGADGPVFIGVNFRDDPAAARAFIREHHVEYPSLEDPSGALAFDFDVPNLPATILVDASGQMRYRIVGAVNRPALLEELIREISG
jgi:thiol-disulfide isomerase/thioredoxin